MFRKNENTDFAKPKQHSSVLLLKQQLPYHSHHRYHTNTNRDRDIHSNNNNRQFSMKMKKDGRQRNNNRLDHNKDQSKGTIKVNATVKLLSSLSCPQEKLPLIRRLMSSQIGITNSTRRRHYNQYSQQNQQQGSLPVLLKSLRKSFLRQSLSNLNLNDKENSSKASSILKNNIESSVNQKMFQVELLFGKLESILSSLKQDSSDDQQDIVEHWIVFFTKLAGTQKLYPEIQSSLDTKEEKESISPSQEFLQNEEEENIAESSSGYHHNSETNANSIIRLSNQRHFLSNILLRECVFCLQGIDGESIRFLPDNNNNSGCDGAGVRVRPGILNIMSSHQQKQMTDIIQICGECGWLYKRIQKFIQSTSSPSSSSGVGVKCGSSIVRRALSEALSKELSEYHRLLAVFESQIGDEVNTNTNNNDKKQPQSKLTFKRLLTWLREPTQRLNALAVLVDGCASHYIGGQLADALHMHAITCGDPQISEFYSQIVFDTTKPIYRMLRNWVMEGILPSNNNNHSEHEFFVVEEDHGNKYKGVSSTWDSFIREEDMADLNNDDNFVWKGKYKLNSPMIPRFIGYGLAYHAFLVGKSINFIRLCLQDPTWRLSFDDNSNSNMSDEQTVLTQNIKTGFQYGQEHVLSQILHFSSSEINKHIKSALIEKHKFMDHLFGLKRILLLGQGDFATALLEGMQHELEKPASRVYIHNLNAILEGALRGSNAKFLPNYVLDRMGVRLVTKKADIVYLSPGRSAKKKRKNKRNTRLPHSNSDSDNSDNEEEEEKKGWDVFSLDYTIQPPISAIFHSQAIRQYRKIFHLLWKLKEIEKRLNQSWKVASDLTHGMFKFCGQYEYTAAEGGEKEGESRISKHKQNASQLLTLTATTRRNMLHFICNFLSYINFGVVEVGWHQLLVEIQKSETLDDLIECHENYLSDIVRKCLLGTTTSTSTMEGLAKHDADLEETMMSYSTTNNASSSSSNISNIKALADQLTDNVLEECSKFCQWQEKTFKKSMKSLKNIRSARKEAESRTEQGMWGFDETKENERNAGEFQMNFLKSLSDPNLLRKAHQISHDFESSVLLFLRTIHLELNTNREIVEGGQGQSQSQFDEADNEGLHDALRYLTFRLDFGDFYKKLHKKATKNQQQRQQPSTPRSKEHSIDKYL